MQINNVGSFDKSLELNPQKITGNQYSDPFKKFFNEAVNLFEQTNAIQKQSEQKQIEFITGKNDDIIGLTMAQSRASSAIQFTSQITSKILTAYQEIMRIAM